MSVYTIGSRANHRKIVCYSNFDPNLRYFNALFLHENSALVGGSSGKIKAYDLQSKDDDPVFSVTSSTAPGVMDDVIRALAWYPVDTGIFFSACGNDLIVWDTNAEKPIVSGSFDGKVIDIAPHLVLSKPIVAGLFLLHTCTKVGIGSCT